jgi:hypothetical protein
MRSHADCGLRIEEAEGRFKSPATPRLRLANLTDKTMGVLLALVLLAVRAWLAT